MPPPGLTPSVWPKKGLLCEDHEGKMAVYGMTPKAEGACSEESLSSQVHQHAEEGS
jgi:hypothetical protein